MWKNFITYRASNLLVQQVFSSLDHFFACTPFPPPLLEKKLDYLMCNGYFYWERTLHCGNNVMIEMHSHHH